MAKITDPIAVFDSGMGGISVLKEMVRLMPEEDFIYYGDSRHAPYGTKPTEVVRRLTIERVTDFIEKKHAKAIAIACNTATSAAVAILRKMYPNVPLVGVEPAIKPAVFACDHPRVLVMATPVTLKEEKFHKLEALYDEQADIYPLPCPGLMEKDLTGVVLGCTHYPFLRREIRAIVGPSVEIFDGSFGTARELRRRITEAGLLREDGHKGQVTFLNSSDDPEMLRRSEYLFRREI